MNAILIILAVAFGIAFLFILGSSLLTSAWVFRMFSRTAKQMEAQMEDAAGSENSERGRAFDLIAKIPQNQEAWKCSNCGAIVDSTAELTASGKVKCNYCNSWSSIYQ